MAGFTYIFVLAISLQVSGNDVSTKLDEVIADLGRLKVMIFHADARVKNLETIVKDVKEGIH